MSYECPKCGVQNEEGAIECKKCGVVFSKLNQIKSKATTSEEQNHTSSTNNTKRVKSVAREFKRPKRLFITALLASVMLIIVGFAYFFLLAPYLEGLEYNKILTAYKIYKKSSFNGNYETSYRYLSEFSQEGIPKAVWAKGVDSIEKYRKSKVVDISMISASKAIVNILSEDFHTDETYTHSQIWIKENGNWKRAYLQDTILKDFKVFVDSVDGVDYETSYSYLTKKSRNFIEKSRWVELIPDLAKRYKPKVINIILLGPNKARIDIRLRIINAINIYSQTWLKEENVWRRAYAEDNEFQDDIIWFGFGPGSGHLL